jgi:hypothetical protein
MEIYRNINIDNIQDNEVSSDNWKKICQYISSSLPTEIQEIIYVLILCRFEQVPCKTPYNRKKDKHFFIITDQFDLELKKKILGFIKFILED